MDSGRISILTSKDKEISEYCITLEDMEEINLGSTVIIINPNGCNNLHIIEMSDFIRTNLNKDDYYNPYSRNKIQFSNDDLEELKIKHETEIQRIKNLPKQIYLQLIEILKLVQTNKLEIFYLPYIINILQMLMGILPLFNNLEESCGLEFPQMGEMITIFEKNIENELLKIKESINEDKDKLLEHQEFCSIPDEMREIFVFKFHQLVDIMNKIVLTKKETEYASSILSIFEKLDKIRGYIESEDYGKIIFNNDKFLEDLYNVLILLDDKIQKINDEVNAIEPDVSV
jgi:hypothetical protein